MTTASDQGPYLLAALLCEKVLTERDGVCSAIRIVDRVTHTVVGPNPPAELEPFDYDLTLLVKMKAGRTRGVYPFTIEIHKPSGERMPPITRSVNFEGEEDRGVDIVANMRFKFDQTGIYWLYFYLDQRKITQIPFRVIYMPQIMQISGPPGPQQSPDPGSQH
jgi:hypothetical protein